MLHVFYKSAVAGTAFLAAVCWERGLRAKYHKSGFGWHCASLVLKTRSQTVAHYLAASRGPGGQTAEHFQQESISGPLGQTAPSELQNHSYSTLDD